MDKHDRAKSALLAVFPTLEHFATFAGNSGNARVVQSFIEYALRSALIETGDERPVRIVVKMSESVGFFQVEEVLLRKIASSPVKEHIEVYAGVEGEEMKRYL